MNAEPIGMIYIAGKYRGETEYEKRENIIKAQLATLKLIDEGWYVFCPHLATANFDLYRPGKDGLWLDMGLKILRMIAKTDVFERKAIYMMEDWEKSEGATLELDHAKAYGMEIIEERE